jgi:hypothetical protein
LRNRLDLKVGLKTPDLFWRCPDCHKKGEIRDLSELDGDIGLMESMEKTITEEGGGVLESGQPPRLTTGVRRRS